MKAQGDASHEELRAFRLEGLFFQEMEPEISSFKKIDSDVQVLAILEGVLNICYEIA